MISITCYLPRESFFLFCHSAAFLCPRPAPVGKVRHFHLRAKNGRDCGRSWRLLIEREVMSLRNSPGHDIHFERDGDNIRVRMGAAWLIAWCHRSQANVDTHAITT